MIEEMRSAVNNWITVAEFARKANVSPQAIHQAMKQGRIRKIERKGPIYLIDEGELSRFFER